MEQKKRQSLAQVALFLVAIVWGSGFVVMKAAVDLVPPGYLVAIRFTLAAALMAAIFHKRLKGISKKTLLAGAVVGLFLFVAYYVQTIAIQYTTAGKNAFLSATYVVQVPFLYWFIRKVRPRLANLVAAVLCIGGIALLSLDGSGFSLSFGDILTLVCSVGFALHIISLSVTTEKHDPIVLTILQFSVVGILGFVCAVPTETFPQLTAPSLLSIVYLTVACTMFALGVQTASQKYVEPSKASLILSLESFFGCLSGVLFLGEPVTLRLIFGFVLIFAAILASELRFPKKKEPRLEQVHYRAEKRRDPEEEALDQEAG